MAPFAWEMQGSEHQGGVFATTHWSIIAAVGHAEEPQAQEALAKLCAVYWYPIYAHLRSHGRSPPDAQALPQGFFLRLLQRDFFARFNPQKGRFRSYLLGALAHFLADEQERKNAQKRGGGQPLVSFDITEAEDRFLTDKADNETPDRLFDRRWALSLLDRVMERLRVEQYGAGKGTAFEVLRQFLVAGESEATYASAAVELGESTAAVSKAVLRLRHRYQRLFWEEISHTVSSPAEAEEELRYLCSVVGN
jgi:DNA-directed RNA polymerase specialized sigma24 family protein